MDAGFRSQFNGSGQPYSAPYPNTGTQEYRGPSSQQGGQPMTTDRVIPPPSQVPVWHVKTPQQPSQNTPKRP
jgi:hypothetical protein